MDISATDLEKLKCISCENYLSRGPVFLQHDGAAVCGRCYAPMQPASRNIQYETTAKYLRFPCKYRDLGCRETVPFVDEEEEIAHEEVCEYRQYACPVLGPVRCVWLGSKRDILQHCIDQHPDKVVDNPITLVHDITMATAQTYLLRAFEVLFLLHTKMCLMSGKIFHAVRYLGASEEATNFDYTLDIKRNDLLISKPGNVSSQGNLSLQEDSSLALTMNSLLDVLDGFDGTTFTVTVKRKVHDSGDQLVKAIEVVKCTCCDSSVTVFRYRDASGWRCDNCAPARRACLYKGCSYTDIDNKSQKHEWYFCEQRTRCWICDAVVPRGTLSAHNSCVHKSCVNRAGSTWRATWTGRCPLSSVAGTAVCYYALDNKHFLLQVYIPVASERLKEFCCQVQVTNPANGHARTYTPDTEYNEQWDWNIEVKREEFQSWNTEFDVSVDILKAEL